MSSVVQHCPLIQELEIMVTDIEKRGANENVSVQELSAIAQLVHIKRLTLSQLNVKDGNFIEQVLKYHTKFICHSSITYLNLDFIELYEVRNSSIERN